MPPHLFLIPAPKNNTVKKPEDHGRICSISHPLSTTHPCNNHTQPGAQSNELSQDHGLENMVEAKGHAVIP